MGAAAVAGTAEEGDRVQTPVAQTTRTSQMPRRVAFGPRAPKKLSARAIQTPCRPHSSSSAPPPSSTWPANCQPCRRRRHGAIIGFAPPWAPAGLGKPRAIAGRATARRRGRWKGRNYRGRSAPCPKDAIADVGPGRRFRPPPPGGEVTGDDGNARSQQPAGVGSPDRARIVSTRRGGRESGQRGGGGETRWAAFGVWRSRINCFFFLLLNSRSARARGPASGRSSHAYLHF